MLWHVAHMRLSKSRPSHWSQVSNRFIYGDPGPKKLDPPERRITTQEALLFSQELRDEEKTGKIVAVWLALTTGIRRSEALALVWDDIDLEGKRLHARRQFGKEKTLDLLSRIRTSYHSWK